MEETTTTTCWGRPRGMNNAPFLNIRAEPERDFVEIAAQNGAVPDGGAVPDCDLACQHDVGCHVGVNGYLGKPLSQGNDPSLSPVVPLHTIRRRRHRQLWLRRLCLDRDRRFRSEVATDQVRSYSSPRESSYWSRHCWWICQDESAEKCGRRETRMKQNEMQIRL